MRSSSKSACSGVRQRLARAASLDREECAGQTFCARNSLVRKIPACLCQVHHLLAADRGCWGCASAHREAEGRRIPGSSRWVLTSTRGIASACPLTDNAHRDPRRGLGRARLMPPQSQLLAYGPASSVNKSLELVLRRRTSPTRRPGDAQRPGTGHCTTRFASMACRAMLASAKAGTNRPPSIQTENRHLGSKWAGMEHRPAVYTSTLCVW